MILFFSICIYSVDASRHCCYTNGGTTCCPCTAAVYLRTPARYRSHTARERSLTRPCLTASTESFFFFFIFIFILSTFLRRYIYRPCIINITTTAVYLYSSYFKFYRETGSIPYCCCTGQYSRVPPLALVVHLSINVEILTLTLLYTHTWFEISVLVYTTYCVYVYTTSDICGFFSWYASHA